MSLLRHATLRQLQIFATAAHHQSLARAAEILHLSQPAVSMQIRQLEETVQLNLFEKVGRNSALTSAGHDLLQNVETILASLKDAEDRLAAIRDLRRGTITVALVSTAKYFVPQMMAGFRERHPQIAIRPVIGNRELLIQLLQRNEMDLAVMGRPPAEIDTVAEAFAPHPHVFIAAPSHPLANKRNIPGDTLAGAPFVVREAGSGTRAVMEKFLASQQLRIDIQMVFSSTESIKQAVMAGMALGFVSAHSLALEIETGRIAVLDIIGTPVVRAWHLVHRRSKTLSPAAQAFRDYVNQHGTLLLNEKFGQARSAGTTADAGVPARETSSP